MNLQRYNYFLFDWDGCLAQTLEIWLAAYRTTFRHHGLDPTDQEIAGIFGDWGGPLRLGVKDNEAFTAELARYVEVASRIVELYPGARDLLDELRRNGKHIALLTSSLRRIIEPGLRHNGIDSLFEAVITAEDVSKLKPDPEIIETALLRLGGKRAEALMIGDSDKDLGAARNANVNSALMFPDSHKMFYRLDKLKLSQPTYVFSGFHQFVQAL